MKWSTVIVTFVLICSVMGDYEDDDDDDDQDEDQDKDQDEDQVQDQVLKKLPGSLDGLDTSQFKEKCLKNADEAAFERADGAKDVAKECIMSLVNVTDLQEELELAKQTGDFDFKKYCRKLPQLVNCINNFTASVEPCLDEAELESKYIIQNITDSLVEFICYQEGDGIARFIAEGGPECLSDHQKDIEVCINQTLSKHIPTAVPSVRDLPELILGIEECNEFIALRNCVVAKLETCKKPTPANIVKLMFNVIYEATPCSKITKEHQQSQRVGDATLDASGSQAVASNASGSQAVASNSSGSQAVASNALFVVATSLLGLAATRYL